MPCLAMPCLALTPVVSLWPGPLFCRELLAAGFAIDTRSYSTAFRVDLQKTFKVCHMYAWSLRLYLTGAVTDSSW
jgi:hypothetical protein